jgi:hypothetical protein
MLCGEKAVIWKVQLGSAAADYVARCLEVALEYDVGRPGWRLSTIGCRVDLLVNGSDGACWLMRRASTQRWQVRLRTSASATGRSSSCAAYER